MTAPALLTVPTCIGCGAMARPGSCPTGCREQRLDLVRAGAHAELVSVRERSGINAAAFRSFAEGLAASHRNAAQLERSYRGLQGEARELLRRHPDAPEHDDVLSEAAEPAVTWWCETCGGLDAPQDCLGICIWRPIEWVKHADYQRERELAVANRTIEARLRAVVRRVAAITPREGHWEKYWQALQDDAHEALGQTSAQLASLPS